MRGKKTIAASLPSERNSPEWEYNEPGDEEDHTEDDEEEVAQALVLGVVGQLSCLKGKKMKKYVFV